MLNSHVPLAGLPIMTASGLQANSLWHAATGYHGPPVAARGTAMPILNQHSITDRITTSGQPVVAEFPEIAGSGHQVVVNLAMPEHEKSIANEGEIVSALGMTYLHIPVPFDDPREEQYELFCDCMDALIDKRVWVHCIVNARVSAFLFRYLQTHRGFSASQAKTPVLEAWLPRMDRVWSDFVSRAPERP